MIVNNSLYSGGQITASLNQYLSDITAQGYTPRLVTNSFADPAALRTYLANEYSTYNIKGAVMVGDMPVEHFERNGQFGDPNDYQRFACDLYYMDVNGTWSDSTANGTYDTHTGNVAPEIWVSHIAPSSLTGLNPGQTEASLLNNYFAKDHQYQIGQLRLPQSGLGLHRRRLERRYGRGAGPGLFRCRSPRYRQRCLDDDPGRLHGPPRAGHFRQV